jgi:hypothetical protein
MSDEKRRRDREAPGRRLRRALSATVLVSAGTCAGLVLGALLDAPRLLLRSWLGPVQAVEVESAAPSLVDEVHLTEFAAIQRETLPAVGASASGSIDRTPKRSEPTSAATPVGRSGPVVQVRAYNERNAAEGLVAELRTLGFDAFISRTRPHSGSRLRVRIAPRSGEPVSRLAGRLEALGYETWTTSE